MAPQCGRAWAHTRPRCTPPWPRGHASSLMCTCHAVQAQADQPLDPEAVALALPLAHVRSAQAGLPLHYRPGRRGACCAGGSKNAWAAALSCRHHDVWAAAVQGLAHTAAIRAVGGTRAWSCCVETWPSCISVGLPRPVSMPEGMWLSTLSWHAAWQAACAEAPLSWLCARVAHCIGLPHLAGYNLHLVSLPALLILAFPL